MRVMHTPGNIIHDGGDEGHVPLLYVAPPVGVAEDQLCGGEKLAQIRYKGQHSAPEIISPKDIRLQYILGGGGGLIQYDSYGSRSRSSSGPGFLMHSSILIQKN